MIVYVGLTRDKKMVAAMRRAHIGRIQQRGQLDIKTIWPGERWAFDNGAFTDWTHKRPFDADAYLDDVQRIAESDRVPALAVAPDLVARGAESLEFSKRWRALVSHGSAWPERKPFRVSWPWYLAVQDGMAASDVAKEIGSMHRHWSGLFLGGSDAFKRNEAATYCDMAHNHGLHFHYGRAGTKSKILHARDIGADSLDSSFPLWTRDRFAEFMRLVGAYQPQASIEWPEPNEVPV